MSKRTYRMVSLQQVDAFHLASALGNKGIVAVDVAKVKMAAGFATAVDGKSIELVRFEQPKETGAFLELLQKVQSFGVTLEFAMEPTGVYGEALRRQVLGLGIPTFRVDAKKVHDMAEVFDGVPSHHDAKSCTLISRLHAQGLSKPWREKSSLERSLRSLIKLRDLSSKPFEMMSGYLEAEVAAHWPEFSQHLERDRSWHLHLLASLPGPHEVRKNPRRAAELIHQSTRGKVKQEKVMEVLACAERSRAEPMDADERRYLQELATHLLEHRERLKKIDKDIALKMSEQPELHSMVKAIGAVTTAVIVSELGNPANYKSGAGLEKAAGLNLRVSSSGERDGRGTIHITKRGPSRVRRYLYLAALRLIGASTLVKGWHRARKSYGSGSNNLKATVAVMRKLVRALPHLARGAELNLPKLFDAKSLPPPTAAETKPRTVNSKTESGTNSTHASLLVV